VIASAKPVDVQPASDAAGRCFGAMMLLDRAKVNCSRRACPARHTKVATIDGLHGPERWFVAEPATPGYPDWQGQKTHASAASE